MDIDWDVVKKQTLWSYEELVKKLLKTLDYVFVRQYYNHNMAQAVNFAEKVQAGYLQGRSEPATGNLMRAKFRQLEAAHVGDYLDLVRSVESREKCVSFLEQTGFGFNELVETLNYLFRMVLPFVTPVRELVDLNRDTHKVYFEKLKEMKLVSNLDVLEQGRTLDGRKSLCQTSGIPEAFMTELVHKADISRLAYVRGKTVIHLCGGGYDTLEKIAGADIEEMEKAMEAHYKTLGKSLADFKAVIPLDWMIGGARILPRVVEIVDYH